MPSLQYFVSNVDVSMDGRKFVMLANTTDLKNIVRYVSDDGLNWALDSKTPDEYLIRGGVNSVLTPHREMIDGNHYRIYFGYDSGGGSQSIQQWEFAVSP